MQVGFHSTEHTCGGVGGRTIENRIVMVESIEAIVIWHEIV